MIVMVSSSDGALLSLLVFFSSGLRVLPIEWSSVKPLGLMGLVQFQTVWRHTN